MANDIGFRIGVEGEKDFKNSIAEINRSCRVLGSEMKAVMSQFEKGDNSVAALTARNEVLNKQIDTQKEKIETLKAALKNAADSFGETDKRTQNWQIQLNNAEAALHDMERELQNNKRDMEAAEGATDDESKALKNMDDAVDSSSGKLKALGSVLKASAAAIAAVSAAAVGVGKKIYDLATQTAAAGDHIDKTSQKIGISAEAYQEWNYVFERSGTDVDNLQNGMKTLNNVIADAASGSATAADKLKAVGLSMEDLNGKSSDEQLSIVIEALQNMEAGAERSAAANDLFGKSASDMAAVLNMTAKETQALKDEANDYGMIMSDDAVKASAAFEDSITKLQGTMNGFKNRMTGELLPGLTSVTNGISDLIAGNADGAKKIKDGISDVMDTVNQLIPEAVQFLSTITDSILKNAPAILENLTSNIVGLIPNLLGTVLTDVLPQILNSVIDITKNLVKSFAAALPQLMMSLAKSIVSVTKDLFSGNNIKEIIGILLDTAKSVIKSLSDVMPVLLEGVFELVNGIVEAMPEIVSMIAKAIPDIVKGISNALVKGIPTLIKGAVELFGGIVKAIPEIVVQIAAAIPQIIASIVEGLLGGVGSVFSAAGELFGAVSNRSDEALSNIEKNNEKIKAFADSLDKDISPKIADYNSLLSNSGSSLDELKKKEDEAENGITEILRQALSDQQGLRDEDIKSIQEYTEQLAKLNEEKMEIYRSQQISELKKLQLESGSITQEGAAQYVANIQEAYDSANSAVEEHYTARLTEIRNYYKALNKVDSEEQLAEEREARNERQKQLDANEKYYNDALKILEIKSQEWVKIDSEKWVAITKAMEQFNSDTGDWLHDIWVKNNDWLGNFDDVKTQYLEMLNAMDRQSAQGFFNMLAKILASGEEIDSETKDIADDILGAFEHLPEGLDDTGKKALLGLIYGMEESIPELKNSSNMSAQEIVDTIKNYLNRHSKEVVDSFESVGTDSVNAFGSAKDTAEKSTQNILDNISDYLRKNSNGIVEDFRSLGIFAMEKFNEGTKSIFGFSPLSFSSPKTYSAKSLPTYADGGVFDKPTLGVFAEAGPEAVVPLKNNTDWINRVARQMSDALYDIKVYDSVSHSSSPNINVSVRFGDVSLASDRDIYDVADQISDVIAEQVMVKARRFS